MRLTTNENGIYVDYDCIIPQTNDIIDKLGQLEDIEEEYAIQDATDLRRRLDLADKYAELNEQLGIDLITLFKALNKKIYTRSGAEHYVGFDLIEQDSEGDYLFNLIDGNYYFKDYGKTWSIDRKELMKNEI